LSTETCPQCGSDDPEVEEIACIRSPMPNNWHYILGEEVENEKEFDFTLDSA